MSNQEIDKLVEDVRLAACMAARRALRKYFAAVSGAWTLWFAFAERCEEDGVREARYCLVFKSGDRTHYVEVGPLRDVLAFSKTSAALDFLFTAPLPRPRPRTWRAIARLIVTAASGAPLKATA